MATSKNSFDKMFRGYDKARAAVKDAEAIKLEYSDEIKKALEKNKLDAVDSVEYLCVYKFDKDKESEVFDEVKFAEKDPKKYQQYTDLMEEMKAITKKYTKTVVAKGARRLIITRKNEGGE